MKIIAWTVEILALLNLTFQSFWLETDTDQISSKDGETGEKVSW